MGSFNIKQKRISTELEYVNEELGLKVEVDYSEDAVTKKVRSYNGQVYTIGSQTKSGEPVGDIWAGRFNGSKDDQGNVTYDTYGVKKEIMPDLTEALNDIEPFVYANEESQQETEEEGGEK
jgi:hypothetical protein